MKKTLVALVALVLAAPANAEGYRKATAFEQVKAQCELIANGLQPSGGFVMGNQQFVAGAMIGSAIGGMIRHAQNYDNCMVLHGYARQ